MKNADSDGEKLMPCGLDRGITESYPILTISLFLAAFSRLYLLGEFANGGSLYLGEFL